MKRFLIAIGILITFTVLAAVTYKGTFIGNGAGMTNIPPSALTAPFTNQVFQMFGSYPMLLADNTTITIYQNSDHNFQISDSSTGFKFIDTTALVPNAHAIVTGKFYGDGSGLTNIGTASLPAGVVTNNDTRNLSYSGSNTFTGGIYGKLIPPVKAAFSTNYTVSVTNGILFCTGTNQLITLPTAPTAGTMFTIVSATTTGSAIVTNGNGSQTILGALAQSVSGTNRLTTVFDGSNWW